MAGEGQPETSQEKSKIIVVLVAVIIIGLAIYIVLTTGWQGLEAFFRKMINWVIFLSILGGVIYLVWKILQKPKVDLTAVVMQDIVDAGTYSKPPMLKDLYFTGDREHGEFKVGKIIGYCQIQSYKDLNIIAGLTETEIDALRAHGKEPSDFIINEDCFIWKKMPFPFSLFERPKVLRCLEDEHSQLIGDVKVYAVSMIKKFGEYYFPNQAFLDVARIDQSVIKEVYRAHIHEFLKDQVTISRRAVGMDATHQKDMEQRKLLKIPTPMGQAEQR
jgi:hypothetical protein